jgi:hypothetical protein
MKIYCRALYNAVVTWCSLKTTPARLIIFFGFASGIKTVVLNVQTGGNILITGEQVPDELVDFLCPVVCCCS